jgi:hypothetical protein
MLDAMGMQAFDGRARPSCRPPGRLSATAASSPEVSWHPSRGQVAKLARDGLSNPEIGARLFISAPHRPILPEQRLHQA